MFKHILVAIDDDPGSRRAITLAVGLAQKIGARVTGFHAMTEFAHPGIVDELLEPPSPELQALARMHADRLFAPLRRASGRAGVKCETLAERGERPGDAIVAAAAQAGCDLIVMASHGRRGLARRVLGSQTQRVLEHAGMSVLAVR
jgi:nucleotide-binding universal stress UspA family protein